MSPKWKWSFHFFTNSSFQYFQFLSFDSRELPFVAPRSKLSFTNLHVLQCRKQNSCEFVLWFENAKNWVWMPFDGRVSLRFTIEWNWIKAWEKKDIWYYQCAIIIIHMILSLKNRNKSSQTSRIAMQSSFITRIWLHWKRNRNRYWCYTVYEMHRNANVRVRKSSRVLSTKVPRVYRSRTYTLLARSCVLVLAWHTRVGIVHANFSLQIVFKTIIFPLDLLFTILPFSAKLESDQGVNHELREMRLYKSKSRFRPPHEMPNQLKLPIFCFETTLIHYRAT